MKLIEELLTTLGNELNNNHSWTFDGRSVVNAEGQEGLEGKLGLLVTLDDDTDVILKAEVLDDPDNLA
jgi:hypothetical protein